MHTSIDHLPILEMEPLRVQTFDKELRRMIVLACLEQGAGFRQLSRLTGVPYGVIHRIFDRK